MNGVNIVKVEIHHRQFGTYIHRRNRSHSVRGRVVNTDGIITKVHAVGGYIEEYDGKLRLTAPKLLSNDLVDLIKVHKSELLVFLRQKEGSDHSEAIREHLVGG